METHLTCLEMDGFPIERGKEMDTGEIIRINPLANDMVRFKTERWVTQDEGAILYSLVTIFRPENCFECGTANGYSALWLSSALGEEGKVHTFDTVDRPKVWDEPTFKIPDHIKDKIVFHNTKFSDGVEGALSNCKGSNIFFIDGDHTQTGVQEDIDSVTPFIKKGDIVAFHDARERAIIKTYLKFIEELKSSNSLEEIFDFKTRRCIKVLKIG